MIYFNGAKNATTLKELLMIGFTYDGGRFQRTYSDTELTIAQCHPARRTFGDLLEIAKTYFPNTTEGELAYLLLNDITNIRAFICPNIMAIVFVRYDSWLQPSGGKFVYTGEQYCTDPLIIKPVIVDPSIDQIKKWANNYAATLKEAA